jgi:hypothetical protein
MFLLQSLYQSSFRVKLCENSWFRAMRAFRHYGLDPQSLRHARHYGLFVIAGSTRNLLGTRVIAGFFVIAGSTRNLLGMCVIAGSTRNLLGTRVIAGFFVIAGSTRNLLGVYNMRF